jgi:hypothetical protein
MAYTSQSRLLELLGAFDHQQLPISDFLVSLLAHSALQDHPSVNHLLAHTDEVLNAFLAHPKSSRSVLQWANTLIKGKYAAAIQDLTRKENGWHFVPSRAAMEKLEEFRIEDMAREMKELSPELWDLIGLLLSADKQSREEDNQMETDNDDLPKDPKSKAEKLAERREALLVIVRLPSVLTRIMNLMMHTDRKKS